MKKLFLLVVVLTALTVFCSAAIAQNGYVVPTLETVRRDGSTVNVYTYRDGNGRPFRTIEYYVNDGGGYGNKDSYYDNQGRLTFQVENVFDKNGERKVTEESLSYAENDKQFRNSRTTTFKPDGTQSILSYISQDTENNTVESNGMLTDGQGRKIYDFKDVTYKDKNRNMISESTLYYPNKKVQFIKEVYKTDETEIREERTWDGDGRQIFYQRNNYDANHKETSSETEYTDYKDGWVITQKLLIDAEEGRMLHYTEKNEEYGSIFIGEGQLLDLNEKKLADYRTERTENKDGSEYRVDSYVYTDGKVDLISSTIDANGNMNITKQLDFQAAGEQAEETSGDDSAYKNFYNLFQNEPIGDTDGPDDELIHYFEEINNIWSEKYDGDSDDWAEEFADDLDAVLDELHDNFNNEPEIVPDESDGEFDEIANEPEDSEDPDGEAESSEDSDDDEADDSEDRDGDEADDSEDWDVEAENSENWDSDDGGSDSWSGDDGGSENQDGDDGGSDSWSGDDGGSEDRDGDDGGSED